MPRQIERNVGKLVLTYSYQYDMLIAVKEVVAHEKEISGWVNSLNTFA